MKPVMQTILDSKKGDCLRAVTASLLELEIEQVPNFVMFGADWWKVFHWFLDLMECELEGTGYFPKCKPTDDELIDCHVDELVIATVKSKNFKDVTHAVLMHVNGQVIHDPTPVLENSYKGVNIIESGELVNWSLVKRKQTIPV